jgi:hypothetical protein
MQAGGLADQYAWRLQSVCQGDLRGGRVANGNSGSDCAWRNERDGYTADEKEDTRHGKGPAGGIVAV